MVNCIAHLCRITNMLIGTLTLDGEGLTPNNNEAFHSPITVSLLYL